MNTLSICRKKMLNAMDAATTTWCVSSTVPRKLTTPCSLCLGEFRCTMSTSSCLWRSELLR